jgi:putative transposase
MPRQRRAARGGVIYHCLNRGNGRQRLFHKPADYDAFMRILSEAQTRVPMDLLGYCLMPNHWHLVLRPEGDGDLPRFMSWMGVTHVRRHHAHYRSRAGGHLYQGRFKSFPAQDDRHLLIVLRYVEANARRAGLVNRAEDWRWGSLAGRMLGKPPVKLAAWPVRRPSDWVELVNQPLDEAQLAGARGSVKRGSPYGDASWIVEVAAKLGLGHTLRPLGRPKKTERGIEK